MPFALVIIGLICIVTAARDTHKQFGQMLVSDFTGPGNFTYWLASIGIVGAIGYNETLRPFSRMFLALIFIGMIIRNGGVFDKFNQALRSGPTPTNATKSGQASGAASILVSGLPLLPSLV